MYYFTNNIVVLQRWEFLTSIHIITWSHQSNFWNTSSWRFSAIPFPIIVYMYDVCDLHLFQHLVLVPLSKCSLFEFIVMKDGGKC